MECNKKGEYLPFMSPWKKKRLKLEYYNDALDAISLVPKLVDLNAEVPSQAIVRDTDMVYHPNREIVIDVDGTPKFIETDYDTPELLIVSNFDDPTFLGIYLKGLRRVLLPLFHRHRLVPAETNRGSAFHEGMHDFVYRWSPNLRNFTKSYDGYYSVNDFDDKAVEIFSPLLKHNKAGSWESSPDEFLAELIRKKGERRIFRPMNESEKLNISSFMSPRFNISSSESNEILGKLQEYGFKYGGKINRF